MDSTTESQPLTLLYLAHLHWNHVWQRPQQLMSRFTRHCRVIYVDTPEIDATATEVHVQELPGRTGVQVLHPVFPAALLDSGGRTYPDLWLQLLPDVLDQAGPN